MALTKSLSFSLGRKRILISNNSSCDLEHFCADFECFTPMKKLCAPQIEVVEDDFSSSSSSRNSSSSSSLLEALPQELLIKVVCGVDHDDLKQLFVVSKSVRDAAQIAKQSHFAYSTPSKTKAFSNSVDMLNNLENSGDFEAPNAPKQARRMNRRRRLDSKKLGEIAVALFADETVVDEEEQRWPRRSLFMDVDS